MSINFNASPSTYFQNKFDFEDISKSAAAGDTRVENAILYGNANLLKAVDMADMLEKTANYTGDATRYAGSQLGTASAVAGVSEGIQSLALGAFKGGHLGGGGGTETIGLGDGFNVGQGQAGLDPAVDLDRYLTASPFSSIPT